jgi:uncharacterized OB-fold protein
MDFRNDKKTRQLFRRPCKKCGKLFVPSTRYSYCCDDCYNKSMKNRKRSHKGWRRRQLGKLNKTKSI